MGLFGIVPWRSLTQVVPLLVDIIFKARSGFDTEKEQKEINELKEKMKVIDGEIGSIYKGLKILIVGMVVVFFVSISSLIIAIIAMSR